MTLTIPRVAGIDLSRPGKQLGFLQVEHSDNTYDAAVIPSPSAVIGNGSGPTALLIAGTHGDEYEGQVMLQQLIRETRPEDLHGTLIVLPALNILAVRDGYRTAHTDGVNLNRALPGSPLGGPAQQIASIVAEDLIPLADFVIDIHSGGSVSSYVPSAFVYSGPTEELWAQKVAAVQAFGMPYSIVVEPMFKSGSISAAADRAGVAMISTELGGGGTISPAILCRARAGLDQLLRHVGVMSGPAGEDAAAREHDSAVRWLRLDANAPVYATMAGLFEPEVELGQIVVAGERIARLHAIEELHRPTVDVHAPMGGVVAIVRRPTKVDVGSQLFGIGVEC